MDPIAKTSLLTAAMRAKESNRSESEGRLFVDPFAELLAGAEGAELMRKGIESSGDQPAIAIRTFYMDSKINQATKNGIRQIVILAAGMDTRAYRLHFPEGTKLFELDRKEVIDYKKQKLQGTQPSCQLISLAQDLRESWKDLLLSSGFQQGINTLWLVEGLLMYLEEHHVLELFNRINQLSIAQDILLFDILSRSLLEAPHMQNQLKFLESLGAPWKFGVNEPEIFMKKLGWDAVVTQPGEFVPSRWPFPVVPRNIPNVPRGFYVEARKLKI